MKQFIFVLSLLFVLACTPFSYNPHKYDLVGEWKVDSVSVCGKSFKEMTAMFEKDTFRFTLSDGTSIFTGEYEFYGKRFVYNEIGKPRVDGCFVVCYGTKMTITEPRYNNGSLRKLFDVSPQEQATIYLTQVE